MSYPITPVRAWMIILTSNRTGRPCVYHMSRGEIEVADRYLAAMVKPKEEFHYPSLLEMFAKVDTGEVGGVELNKLRAAILLTQEDLASYMHDNESADEANWEDEFPELDSLRDWLQEFVI